VQKKEGGNAALFRFLFLLPLRFHDLLSCLTILDATASTSGLGRAPFGRGHSATSALLCHVKPPCF
jgi:hypothetical protein